MTIDFLNVCWDLKRKITIESDKISQLRRLITSINSNIDGLPRGNDKVSKIDKLTASIIDGENKIFLLRSVWQDCLIDLAAKLLNLISDNTIRNVILYRYGYCKPFKDIATDLGFCERQIYKFHSAGLSILKFQLQDSCNAVTGQLHGSFKPC